MVLAKMDKRKDQTNAQEIVDDLSYQFSFEDERTGHLLSYRGDIVKSLNN